MRKRAWKGLLPLGFLLTSAVATIRTGTTLAVALVVALAAVCLTMAPGAKPAQAAHSGFNGKLAFTSARAGTPHEIYTMDTRGLNTTRLTTNSEIEGFPSWSPNGQELVFDRGGDIYKMNSQGKEQTLLLSGPNLSYVRFDDAQWAPDGKRIVFNCLPKSTHTTIYLEEICTMNVITGAFTRLIRTGPADQAPTWSPNGRQIAFEKDGDIHVMNAAPDARQVRLTTAAGADPNPRTGHPTARG